MKLLYIYLPISWGFLYVDVAHSLLDKLWISNIYILKLPVSYRLETTVLGIFQPSRMTDTYKYLAPSNIDRLYVLVDWSNLISPIYLSIKLCTVPYIEMYDDVYIVLHV